MKQEVSAANVSFEFLSNSSDFMNLILNNITSCVLLLDGEMNLFAFNDALKTIFSNKDNEHLLHVKCGNAIGCAHAVEEQTECGTTSHCQFCELRTAALSAYIHKKAILKQRLTREFYKTNNLKETKHLLFSVRPFYFKNDYYVIVIVEDLSMLVKQSIAIDHQKEMINTLCNS